VSQYGTLSWDKRYTRPAFIELDLQYVVLYLTLASCITCFSPTLRQAEGGSFAVVWAIVEGVAALWRRQKTASTVYQADSPDFRIFRGNPAVKAYYAVEIHSLGYSFFR
jgi:hypothetical protein